MITLHLLHPTEKAPMQKWTFESESVIRIGRVDDNHVILYSSVVSRHHAELRRQPDYWEIVGLGANGTFINGEKIDKAKITSGTIFRMANSGPRIQIFMDSNANLDGNANIPESKQTVDSKPETPTERRTFLAPRRDK